MTQSELSRTLESVFEKYPNLCVVGGAFGDEGKGKIAALLSHYYDVVARFAGGSNAGHTYFTSDGKKMVSHLIPCGLAAGKTCVIGRGVLVNLESLLGELDAAAQILGPIPAKAVLVDQQSVVWTPYHPILEAYFEQVRGAGMIKTTGQGIGPMAGLHRLRTGVLVGELFAGSSYCKERLKQLHDALWPLFSEMARRDLLRGINIPSADQVADGLLALAPKIRPMLSDTSFELCGRQKRGARILAEGAQSTGLDLSWGTYPFVSSTMSTAAGAALGLGLPPATFRHTLLVTKVLPTRVGAGPFPSEIWERESAEQFPKSHPELFRSGKPRAQYLKNVLVAVNAGSASNKDIARYFQVLGDERGATTGRGRSVGYLDLPWLRYAIRLNQPMALALTRFDMLSGLKRIPVVTEYLLNGQLVPAGQMPPSWELAYVKPLCESWPCWPDDISGCCQEDLLPQSARHFLTKLERELGVPILLVGTGPKHADIILRAGAAERLAA
ncbi:MAG: adenylosuccinate synthetase [Candidatus Doudnabacteria bacterium]|nr:adenylosuccinate synthetase [Candidatus Doudnabacteria bacterium]